MRSGNLLSVTRLSTARLYLQNATKRSQGRIAVMAKTSVHHSTLNTKIRTRSQSIKRNLVISIRRLDLHTSFLPKIAFGIQKHIGFFEE